MHWKLLHIGIWLLGYLLINLSNWTFGAFTAGTVGYWLVSFYGTLFNALLFYIHANYLLPKFLNRRKWYWYILLTISLLFFATLIETWFDFVFILYYPRTFVSSFGMLLQESLLVHAVFFLGASYLYRLTKDWFIHEQQKQRLKEQKLSAELSFLKAQINPHFLFNTLNNLFALAHQNDDSETAAGIAKLSGMMRYMLEESEANSVSLESEIKYLDYYIELQSLRFSAEDSIKISFVKKGNIEGLVIAPLLLIPFVENAFKHGVSLNHPSFITIELEVQRQQILFSVKNSAYLHKTGLEQENHGIGLQNVKERLKLLYPNRHQLKTLLKNKEFMVELQIQCS